MTTASPHIFAAEEPDADQSGPACPGRRANYHNSSFEDSQPSPPSPSPSRSQPQPQPMCSPLPPVPLEKKTCLPLPALDQPFPSRFNSSAAITSHCPPMCSYGAPAPNDTTPSRALPLASAPFPPRDRLTALPHVQAEALPAVQQAVYCDRLEPEDPAALKMRPGPVSLEHLPPSSPLSSVLTQPDGDTTFSGDMSDTGSSLRSPASSPVSEPKSDRFQVEYDLDGPPGHDEHPIFRLKPTVSQWRDFPAILDFARSLGAAQDGCFKVILPPELQHPLPAKAAQMVPGHAYKIRQVKRNGFWQVHTVPSEGRFEAPEPAPEPTESVTTELRKLKKLFNKNRDKQIRSVRYRVDVPAWTAAQRRLAGVPERSPMHPLRGDLLGQTKAIVPGIHTPYVYEANDHFGATFQIHAEDYRLVSLNHLYKGRKIWIVIPSTAMGVAEEAFGRKKKCSQFMRHRGEFFFPEKLMKMGMPYRVVDQRPGETIVVLPDAYHEGFSTGYTLAEAKNYAEASWSTKTYQACDASCQLLTAIPAAFMAPLEHGEERLDLCAHYGDDGAPRPLKRVSEEGGPPTTATPQGSDVKRIKI